MIREIPYGIGELELIAVAGDDLSIVNSARVSYGKRKTEIDESDKKLIKYLINHNHVSTLEHCFITFKARIPKPIAVQWMRHKWAYNEQSGRYIEIEDEFYTPQSIRKQHESSKQASVEFEFPEEDAVHIRNIYYNTYKIAHAAYKQLISKGVAKEQARMVLPFGFYTEMWASCNLRSFLHWYKARSDSHAQWEFQEIAKTALSMVEDKFPVAIAAFKEKEGIA